MSPQGVRAQTCVLTRDGAVWGRMYHRNTTGEALYGALSLLGPGGRAVTAPCELPADGRAGVCDTPHRRAERTSPPSLPSPEGEPYTAVAEIASPDGEGLLLRTGSETGGARGRRRHRRRRWRPGRRPRVEIGELSGRPHAPNPYAEVRA
ncbi:hypothetical protein LUW77_16935 [Streptomyces radiopugnans]|nr:hypothetical protein LUW77_16935 [Streptomyces radiopugnans]